MNKKLLYTTLLAGAAILLVEAITITFRAITGLSIDALSYITLFIIAACFIAPIAELISNDKEKEL